MTTKLLITPSDDAEKIFREYQRLYGEINNCKPLSNDATFNMILENLKEELNDPKFSSDLGIAHNLYCKGLMCDCEDEQRKLRYESMKNKQDQR